MSKFISIKGARENNLKGIDVEIPHNKFVVITGVSGSGKSSLAFDTIFREGQRKYLETFSSSARQLISKLQRPNVESIEGLTPTIAVNQATVIRNPHSTVGTLTELHDYLRLLFARFGHVKNKELKVERQLFSFNHPKGACPNCKGLGVEDRISEDLLISDHSKTIREGALVITAPNGYIIYSQVTLDVLNQVCNAHGFDIDIPWQEMNRKQKDIILFGSDIITIPFGKHTLESRMKWSGITAKPREEGYYKGIIPVMEVILNRDRNKNILRFVESKSCSVCEGARLNTDALSVEFQGKSIADYSVLSIEELEQLFSTIILSEHIGIKSISEKICSKTKLLNKLGLSYLTMDRSSTSLSGGEAQRIRLANQITNGLQGVTYVFDEPSIGLHDSEQDKLLEVLHSLVENGNSLIVVEHDEKTIRSADHLIDIGPDAGTQGGELVFSDTIEKLLNPANQMKNSHTHNWLSGRDNIISKKLPLSDENTIFWLKDANKNNLKNISVEFKSNALNVICGVSGAGKSSLVESLIEKSIIPKTNGAEIFSQHVFIDQSPIGRTPRSNPATYTKVFDLIRKLFGELVESKSKGWDKSRFSFNVKGGRCEACEGAGYQQIGMHFLGNVDVICQHCNGKRFNAETLAVQYHSKSINDVLEMTIDEACLFFEDQKAILKILQTMQELGLGYIGLGQSSTTLSGGEAQRIKLASELWKSGKGQTLYILDEPTTGLHHKDVKALIRSLQSLVNNGHTVITIEHHAEMLKAANYLVELGPGSGKKGGELVFSGSPEQLINENKTLTAKALQQPHQSISIKERKAYEADFIKLKNVSTHNLRSIDVDIPLGKMTVITGVSGSGKSSLAFDTLYAEGQRRFLESVSTYARTFMKSIDKPDIEEIQNLNPVVAIGQRNTNTNARSTVGTLSEVYDYYRLLYSRIGYIICPKCKAKAVNGICACGWKVENKATASHFSFNHESGACPVCKGLGTLTVCDPEKLISHPDKSIYQGAMDGHKSGKFYGDFYGQYVAILQSISKENSIDFEKPWNELDENTKRIILFGTGEKDYKVNWHYKRKNREGVEKFTGKWVGFCHLVNEEYQRKHADKRADAMLPIMKEIKCSSCNGSRLNKQSLDYLFKGVNIAELSSKTIKESILFFSQIDRAKHDSTSKKVLNDILPPILHKLNMFSKAGLSYLNMNRTISTLSGGESQRLRLASSLGTGLCGITYILDEPTVGLHPRDTQNLIAILQELKKQDNTLVIVEHDEDVIQAADHVIELGPSAGNFGGIVQYAGKPEASLQSIKKKSKTLNLDFNIKIQKANTNNLKGIDVELPSNGMTVFSGVSGSGKTSLLFSVLADSATQGKAINCQQISGLEQFDSIIPVTQYQVSNHPSSIVATFTGIFDDIRKLFADTAEAKKMNLSKSHFSFNNKAGYCVSCQGLGQTKISMDFLADVWSICEECKGRRYNDEVQSVKLKGQSISDVLDMSIDSSIDYFEDRILKVNIELLQQTGLGYLKVGQTTRTLSGGESQRLKLSSDIINGKGGKNLYLFDEPTKGLHREDIDVLLQLFNKLIAQGHCLYIIEHNLQVISQADWVVDLGPEGGDEGGEIIFQGLLADLIKCDESYTGLHVKQSL